MGLGWLIAIGIEYPVPGGQEKSIVAVMLSPQNRMVNPVHVRCNNNPAKYPIQRQGQRQVRVVEHGPGHQQKFEYQYRNRRGTKRSNDSAL